jgi:KipI family sensor histidine kinase inhibitor
MKVRDYGDRALLLECVSGAEVLALSTALGEADVPGVSDIVPGARTVLVTLDGPTHQSSVRSRLAGSRGAGVAETAVPQQADVVIDVVYDGADLNEVAVLTGMSVEDVIAAHTGRLWRVGFGGFAPGFAYLIDGDPRLEVPRRSEPRTRVPAGSVGLAGEFSGVYPRESPGGWQLIGHTDALLWDTGRAQPALLAPGMRVRFRATPSGARPS